MTATARGGGDDDGGSERDVEEAERAAEPAQGTLMDWTSMWR
nr:hypothetical protein [Tepidiforma sp.]